MQEGGLSCLTNSAPVYEPKWGGGGDGGGGCGVSANKYSCADGAQIIFGDLIPYLTYQCKDPSEIKKSPLCYLRNKSRSSDIKSGVLKAKTYEVSGSAEILNIFYTKI